MAEMKRNTRIYLLYRYKRVFGSMAPS